MANKRLEQQIQQIVAQEVAKVFSGSAADKQAQASGQQASGQPASGQPASGQQATGQQATGQSQTAGGSGQNAAPTPQMIKRIVGQTVASLVPGGISNGSNQGGGNFASITSGGGMGPGVAVHAAQVLGQAEMELSNELSANLQKLKIVIQDSQRIAQKIETVLGKG